MSLWHIPFSTPLNSQECLKKLKTHRKQKFKNPKVMSLSSPHSSEESCSLQVPKSSQSIHPPPQGPATSPVLSTDPSTSASTQAASQEKTSSHSLLGAILRIVTSKHKPEQTLTEENIHAEEQQHLSDSTPFSLLLLHFLIIPRKKTVIWVKIYFTYGPLQLNY